MLNIVGVVVVVVGGGAELFVYCVGGCWWLVVFIFSFVCMLQSSQFKFICNIIHPQRAMHAPHSAVQWQELAG